MFSEFTGITPVLKQRRALSGEVEYEQSVFDQPDNFTNRELSWLEFNQRILGEARDRKNPLFERMKFLSITASNLDEFFMVRIASLKDMVNAGYQKKDVPEVAAPGTVTCT